MLRKVAWMPSFVIRPIPGFDHAAQMLAALLPGISGAGVFHLRGATPFLDLWREDRSITLRLGTVEVVVDLQREAYPRA
ncbi:hypothetical protein [Azohydromonas sediminis]|uniref:hypothetical protein n=1 Tax=Azohydromonas sediminis TaxID=2259674 RepID=UPI000E659AC0|nr:hypothetical protein [Azohydromonas sediminis]